MVDVVAVDTLIDAEVVDMIAIVEKSLLSTTLESSGIFLVTVGCHIAVHRTKVRLELMLEMVQLTKIQEKKLRK